MDSKEEAVKRSRLTLYLLLAGSAVLLVPLLILLYLRSTEGGASGADAGARAFARRENRADRINAAQTPAPAIMDASAAEAAAQGGSLGFVKASSDFLPPPQPSTETAKAPEPVSAAAKKEVAKAEPPPQQPKAKAGPKPFAQPRLQGTKFSTTNFAKGFGSSGQRGGKGGQMGGKGGMPQMPAGAGMPDMGAMMQGMMPGGAGGAGGAAGGGMPDMSSLMKGMMPGPSAVGGGTAGTAQPGTTTK